MWLCACLIESIVLWPCESICTFACEDKVMYIYCTCRCMHISSSVVDYHKLNDLKQENSMFTMILYNQQILDSILLSLLILKQMLSRLSVSKWSSNQNYCTESCATAHVHMTWVCMREAHACGLARLLNVTPLAGGFLSSSFLVSLHGLMGTVL